MDALRISNLSFSYENVDVLSNISLHIHPGDFVGILGPNGSGKTTLMKLILGFLEQQKGKIELFGIDSKNFKSWDLVGYVPQRYAIEPNFPGTVEEILSLVDSKNQDAIRMLEITNLLKKRFFDLSGGQQQRVLIALSLLSNPKLLILDEPTVGVDIKAQQDFYALLRNLNQKSAVTILLVTHDVGLISNYVKKVIFINKNVCCEAKSKDIEKVIKQMYGKDFEIFHHEEEK